MENVDRSWRNPNLLVWHRELWLIDHGASLYFHHNWPRAEAAVHRAYRVEDHVLAPYASRLAEADAELAPGSPRTAHRGAGPGAGGVADRRRLRDGRRRAGRVPPAPVRPRRPHGRLAAIGEHGMRHPSSTR
ncbi:hypothetical protein NKG94_49915 [Micromonospora sp. M12]